MRLKEQTIRAMEMLELETLHTCVQTLSSQCGDMRQIVEVLRQGMKLVGDRFARGEYFLADLIVSGMMFKSAISALEVAPRHPDSYCGKLLIGVMSGDIHDIGKDVVVQVMQTESFDVLDLGVDVPADAFVQAALNYAPDIIALSGIMASSAAEMKRVVEALKEAKISPKVPIVVGGSCVSDLIAENIGEINYPRDLSNAVLFCKNVMERKSGHEKNRQTYSCGNIIGIEVENIKGRV